MDRAVLAAQGGNDEHENRLTKIAMLHMLRMRRSAASRLQPIRPRGSGAGGPAGRMPVHRTRGGPPPQATGCTPYVMAPYGGKA